MLSPVKAITAGALIFAIGGAFLIAQPFDQSSSVPGAAPETAVSVARGQFSGGNWGGGESLPADGMMERLRDAKQVGRLEMSDPRLSGEATLTYNVDRWATDEVEEGDVGLFWGDVTIENDGGSWVGTHLTADGQARDRAIVFPVMQLTGTGDYDGLSAILYLTSDPSDEFGLADSVDGLIFSGDLPPNR